MEGKGSALAAAEALEDFSFLDREYEALGRWGLTRFERRRRSYLQPDNVSAVAYLPEDGGRRAHGPGAGAGICRDRSQNYPARSRNRRS